MELICFDLDNTLVDSDKMHVLAFNKAFGKNNLPEVNTSKLVKLFGLVGELVVKKIYPNISDEKIKKIVKDHNIFVIKETKRFVKPFPDVKKILSKLKKKGYELGVVSNCSHKEIKAVIASSGLSLKLFDIVVGNDDVKHGKPCPDEILKAEKLLHHEADYMVGDSPYDIIAGRKSGCKTISVLTGNFSRKRLKEEHPDYIIKSLKELPEVLENNRKNRMVS